MEEKRKDEGLKVNFLLNICNMPDLNIPEKLKSNYGLTCRVTADLGGILLPLKFKSMERTCQFCSLQWNDRNCQVKIRRPTKPGAAMRRIIKKLKKKHKLSNIEKKLAMRVHSGNIIVITCSACNKKTNIRVHKPAAPVLPKEQIEFTTKKKKKKKITPILNLPVISTQAVAKPQESTINLIDDSIVMDTRGDLSNLMIPATKQLPGNGFIPLDASTPMVKKRKERQLLVNPLAVKNLSVIKKPLNVTKKNIRYSLKKLLAEDTPKPSIASNALKGFLSNL